MKKRKPIAECILLVLLPCVLLFAFLFAYRYFYYYATRYYVMLWLYLFCAFSGIVFTAYLVLMTRRAVLCARCIPMGICAFGGSLLIALSGAAGALFPSLNGLFVYMFNDLVTTVTLLSSGIFIGIFCLLPPRTASKAEPCPELSKSPDEDSGPLA